MFKIIVIVIIKLYMMNNKIIRRNLVFRLNYKIKYTTIITTLVVLILV